MIPRHVRHPKRDFSGFLAAFAVYAFLAFAIGYGWFLIERTWHG